MKREAGPAGMLRSGMKALAMPGLALMLAAAGSPAGALAQIERGPLLLSPGEEPYFSPDGRPIRPEGEPVLPPVESQPLPPPGQGQPPEAQPMDSFEPIDPSMEGESIAPQEEAEPEKIENKVAVFSGLDKITGRIITFDVYIDETVQFGALQVTPRVCYTRPDTAAPKTTSFVEVDEITLDRKIRRIFTGWMFADSPGLNAVEHAVYDVWLKDCKMESDVPPPETN